MSRTTTAVIINRETVAKRLENLAIQHQEACRLYNFKKADRIADQYHAIATTGRI